MGLRVTGLLGGQREGLFGLGPQITFYGRGTGLRHILGVDLRLDRRRLSGSVFEGHSFHGLEHGGGLYLVAFELASSEGGAHLMDVLEHATDHAGLLERLDRPGLVSLIVRHEPIRRVHGDLKVVALLVIAVSRVELGAGLGDDLGLSVAVEVDRAIGHEPVAQTLRVDANETGAQALRFRHIIVDVSVKQALDRDRVETVSQAHRRLDDVADASVDDLTGQQGWNIRHLGLAFLREFQGVTYPLPKRTPRVERTRDLSVACCILTVQES